MATEMRRWSMRALSRVTLNPVTSRQLLEDTSLRLEGQVQWLDQLRAQVLQHEPQNDDAKTEREDIDASHDNTISSTSSTTTTKRGIVRATNHQFAMASLSSSQSLNDRQYLHISKNRNRRLLDWKGHLEREQDEQRALHRADAVFRNLQVLHHDTRQLLQHLLESKSIWTNYTKAHQSTLAATMEQIRSRHATTMETIADLVLLLRPYASPHHQQQYVPLVTNFLRGRLGVQILCDHYVALHKGKVGGTVSVDCSLEPVLQEAWTEAKHLCEAHYQTSPDVLFPKTYPIATMTFIRPWLHHSLVEMLKNSMVASMEVATTSTSTADTTTHLNAHGDMTTFAVPPIEIIVHVGPTTTNEDGAFVYIDIQDHGKGFGNDDPFLFASSPDKWDRLDVQQSYATVRSPLSSLGVGVPSSQWLMQHFGGNLQLTNRPQGGCTATLVLPMKDDELEFVAPWAHSQYSG